MASEISRRHLASWGFTGGALILISVFVSLFVIIGADFFWLVPLGQHVLDRGTVPDGLPFAAAPTSGWPNVLVLAQVATAVLHVGGPVAMAATQVAAGLTALTLVAWGARQEGAGDRATGTVLLLVALGSLTALVIVRLQVFSLVPFALLLVMLRSDQARPSRRLWLVPVVVAIWSNLHGAVLTGVAVVGAYLLFSRLRRRPGETVALGVATLAALLLTPAGWRTIPYYVGVLENEAAARGTELWARPTLSNVFDVLLLIAAGTLIVLCLRRRRPFWEYVVLAGLAVGTATAARHGVWLLVAAAAPAALHATRRQSVRQSAGIEGPPLAVPILACAAALVLSVPALVARGPLILPADQDLVDTVTRTAGDRVVLAPEPLVESLVVEGVRVWVSDPIDAFSHADQSAYLDFLEGGGPAAGDALVAAEVVVVRDGSRPTVLVERSGDFVAAERVGGWTIYERTSP